MLNKLAELAHNTWYWLGLFILGLSMEGIALFYQYFMDEPPCVLCIHVRVWVLGFTIIAALAIFIKNQNFMKFAHIANSVMMVGLLERSYQLVGVERGFIFGACNMESGLPSWFALDRWLPAVFEVQAACGYTPYLLFKISMADGLILMSGLLSLISIALVVVSFIKK